MGKQQSKKPLIRFPEFKDAWEQKFGNEVFNSVSDKNHNSDLPILAISQEFGAVPRELINYQISVTEKSIDSYKVIEIGDFIISLRSFQGGIEYSNYKGICSPAYIILRPIIEVDRMFFKYYFKTYRYIQHLNRKLEGIRDGKMISYKYFSEIAMPFPSLPEQTRIASFFTVLDKKIAELKQKKTLIEQYKKGVMQRLFKTSSESGFSGLMDDKIIEENEILNSSNPKNRNSVVLRFKDENGKEFPKWEKKKLGEIAFKISSSIAANTIEDNIGDYIIYGASGILKSVDFFREEEEYISIVKDGAGVGRVYLCVANSSVLGTMDIIKPINCNLYYLFYFLQQTNFLKYITGSTIPHIYFSDYKVEGILVPCIEEQTQIALFLSAIDEKINRTETQIKQTQEYKKGLLQNMFC